MMKLPAVLLLALLVPTEALACSCVQPQPVDEALADAVRVFHGQVTSVESVPPLSRRVSFRVIEHFKGEPADTIELTTAVHSATCGYPFADGVAYVVYAHGKDDDLRVSSCSRTTPAIDGSDLDVLRAAD